MLSLYVISSVIDTFFYDVTTGNSEETPKKLCQNYISANHWPRTEFFTSVEKYFFSVQWRKVKTAQKIREYSFHYKEVLTLISPLFLAILRTIRELTEIFPPSRSPVSFVDVPSLI